MEKSALERLRGFRQGVFDLCSHRADALCNVIDGALTAGLVPSFAYLSLQAAHQRGHGSLYAALAKGRVDVEGIRKLVASTLPEVARPVYAIDTSTYIRSDAETSPERGIYYHTSRHSAGKPVVAGWSYSWCAQLGETRSSWTAPVDVSRVPIEVDAHDIAGQQMRAVITSLPAGVKPLFAFDAGYDPTRLAEQVAEDEAAVLVRLRRNRCFYADPLEEQERRVAGPRRMAPSSSAMTLAPGLSPTLSTTKRVRSTVTFAFAPGAVYTLVFRTIPDEALGRPNRSSEEHSFFSRSPSCPGKPVSPEPSGCGGGVLVSPT